MLNYESNNISKITCKLNEGSKRRRKKINESALNDFTMTDLNMWPEAEKLPSGSKPKIGALELENEAEVDVLVFGTEDSPTDCVIVIYYFYDAKKPDEFEWVLTGEGEKEALNIGEKLMKDLKSAKNLNDVKRIAKRYHFKDAY